MEDKKNTSNPKAYITFPYGNVPRQNIALIWEYIEIMNVGIWEDYLQRGWRHNGCIFFRAGFDENAEGRELGHLPLRNRLDASFSFNKKHRALLRKNADLRQVIRPARIDAEKIRLFEQHVTKFTYRHPESIYDFVSDTPDLVPFPSYELCLYKADTLVACSFIDIGARSVSSTYAMYDLNESKRSLGIYTMILEMIYAKNNLIPYYYAGYVFTEPSFLDYKKSFNNTEYYNWLTQKWLPLSHIDPSVR